MQGVLNLLTDDIKQFFKTFVCLLVEDGTLNQPDMNVHPAGPTKAHSKSATFDLSSVLANCPFS